MKIEPLFPGLMRYPTATELKNLNAGDQDMRHPDDKIPDNTKPDGRGIKKKAIELAKIIWGASADE